MEENNADASLEQPQKGETKKRSSKKLLIVIIGAVFILAGGGFLAYTMLLSEKEKATETENHKKEEILKPVLFSIDPFVVNLSKPGRYLKVTMQFELKDESYQEMAKQKIPNLRDIIITLVSSKSFSSVSGPEGKFQLKDEILLRANQVVGKDVFKNLYFTDFVMQ